MCLGTVLSGLRLRRLQYCPEIERGSLVSSLVQHDSVFVVIPCVVWIPLRYCPQSFISPRRKEGEEEGHGWRNDKEVQGLYVQLSESILVEYMGPTQSRVML